MDTLKQKFDHQTYYQQHKEQYKKNMRRWWILHSNQPAAVKTEAQKEHATIKKGRPSVYQNDEERQAVNRMNRQQAMIRFKQRKMQSALLNQEFLRLSSIEI